MNAKTAWRNMLEEVRKGRLYKDRGGRQCIELINNLVTIDDPSDAIELVRLMQRQEDWVYPSPEELKSIIVGTPNQGAFEYSYVPRLFGEHNQIDGFVIPLLKQDPESRRAVAILYQPFTDSELSSKNVPGLLALHFRLLEKLELTCIIRSNDVFIGLPANLYQLRCLQEYVAGQLGAEPGAIHVFSGSAHFFTEYEEQYQNIAKAIKKEGRPE